MKFVINIILFGLVLFSAFEAITVHNDTRQLFTLLDNTKKTERTLNDDFARLQLEQTRLSNMGQIQSAAAAQGMGIPHPALTKIFMVH